MKRFWISWWDTEPDYRPLTHPPTDGIIGWWCSGSDSLDRASLVAWVEAKTKTKALALLRKNWPETKGAEFRFVDEVATDWAPNDRFPLKAWMERRTRAAV